MDTVSGKVSLRIVSLTLPCKANRVYRHGLPAPPKGAGGGQRRLFDPRCRRQGRFHIDTLLCRYLYWYQHNSITEILFLPPPPRFRKGSFALCGVTEPWCSGSRRSVEMPGQVEGKVLQSGFKESSWKRQIKRLIVRIQQTPPS